MDCERESFQSNTELVVGMKPISISPCGANEDNNARIQPIPMSPDWKEDMISESRESFHGGIASVPAQGNSIDELESGLRNELDSTPLDYRIDWTTQMNRNQKRLAFQENNDIQIDDTFLSLGNDDASTILGMSEEETFDKDEIISLSMWLKSNKDSDIWVI